MKELVQYMVELKREYKFYLYQEDNLDMSNQISKVFDPDSFWLDEEQINVYKKDVANLESLNKLKSFNEDILVLKINKLESIDNEEEIINEIIEEKNEQAKEEEFLKYQLKFNF